LELILNTHGMIQVQIIQIIRPLFFLDPKNKNFPLLLVQVQFILILQMDHHLVHQELIL